MFLTELTDLLNRGYSVAFHPEYSDQYPKKRADNPIRCAIDNEDHGSNGWADNLPDSLADAIENLKYVSDSEEVAANN